MDRRIDLTAVFENYEVYTAPVVGGKRSPGIFILVSCPVNSRHKFGLWICAANLRDATLENTSFFFYGAVG